MTSNPSDVIVELRQSLERLLQTDFSLLHQDIEHIQTQIQSLEGLSTPLPEDINRVREALQKLKGESEEIEQQVLQLQNNLTDLDQVTGLVRLGLAPALQEEIKNKPTNYGEIIAPIITPAITNQIRNARPEMIAALYPIIGQTIGKAISEAMYDLRRRIDANLQQNLNFSQQFRRFRARLKGVSATDLILRESLDYKIIHIFLIHRKSGLLLKQISRDEEQQDSDIFSAMLTAIRDFAQDTFSSKEEELEEIQYGASHILLRNGIYAYLAVVVEGVQPSGYAALMQYIIHQINLEYEKELQQFSGEMDRLHDYREELLPLLNPSSDELETPYPQATLSRNQKIAMGWGGLGVLILISFLIFACVFSIRLMPVAFPSPTQTIIPATSTSLPAITPSPTASQTPTHTPTAAPTSTPSPVETLGPILGFMTGNVWVRLDPIQDSTFQPVAIFINTPVEIIAKYDNWVKISWQGESATQKGWVPIIWVEFSQTIPSQLITPVE